MADEETNVIDLGRYNKGDIYHPLMGKAGITLNHLLIRSTPEAEEALRLAGRFTRYRIDRQKEIKVFCERLAEAPWTGEHPSPVLPGSEFMAMDLARALMAL